MGDFLQKYRLCQAERIKGLCLSQVSDITGGVICLERALTGFQELLETTQDPDWNAHILHDLGVILFDLSVFYYENGNMLAAQTNAQESLDIWRKIKTNYLELAKLLNMVGYLHYQCGEYRAAWQAFQEARDIHELLEKEGNYVRFLNSLGDLQLDLEEWVTAEETYTNAILVGKKMSGVSHVFGAYVGLSRLKTRQGNFDQAFQYLREAARVRKLNLEGDWYQGRLGEIYLEMGQYELAIETLQKVVEQSANQNVLRQEDVLAGFELAYAFFANHQNDQALENLELCLKGAARLGYDQFLVIAGRRAKSLLQFASNHWPNHPQLQSLRKRIDSFQVGVAQYELKHVIAEHPPAHLEILALGAGIVRRDGQIIPKAAWRSSKARALIFYLIEKGGEARGADIRSDFWPEFAVGQATSNFQATLWRTRNALGNKDFLINEGDQYTLGEHVTFWYDVGEFRTCLKRAGDPSISAFERAELWRQAIRVYQGNYLEDIFMDWTNSQRVELENLYVQTLVSLAGWCVKQRHYADARILYKQALDKDVYRDDIHLALMQCLVYSGAPNAAISHFLDYQRFLKKENLSPSQVLTDYYRHLLR